jgi:hypothetical protein
MHKEDFSKVQVGQCGSCGLRMFFWGPDGARVTCVGCGREHEVEVDAALDLGSGETREVVMLVLVWGAKNESEGRADAGEN